MCPEHPEPRNLHRVDAELLTHRKDECTRRAVPSKERRRVLAPQRVRREFLERLGEECAMQVQHR